MSPWYTRQDRDRDHDSVRVRAFALEALEQLKASFAVVSESGTLQAKEHQSIHASAQDQAAWTPARQRDELIDKSCNNHRRIVGCVLSGARRVHPVIVGWSTPQIAPSCPDPSMIIPDACSLPHGLGQLPDKLGRRA